jgi:hypothetical protein
MPSSSQVGNLGKEYDIDIDMDIDIEKSVVAVVGLALGGSIGGQSSPNCTVLPWRDSTGSYDIISMPSYVKLYPPLDSPSPYES